MLRSVSPVCIDDLTTMGVRASMSMSIVIDGRLCGLLACHHMTPRQVPFAVRRAGACCKGLGLYIAHEIARGHGGTLAYNYVAPDVVFTFGFPTHPSDALHGDLPVVSSASAPLPRMVPKSAPAPAN